MNSRRVWVALAASSVLALGLLASPALGGGTSAGPNVQITEDGFSVDTFQALNATNERSRSRGGQDSVGFSQNLHPPVLSGHEGRSDTFVSLGAQVETPSSSPFPTGPIHDIAMTGRLRDEATKRANNAPGVPVGSSEGDFSADFTTSGPTPFLFSGAMNAQNTDPEECTEVEVDLDGPLSRTFKAQGGDCPGPRHRGFVVDDVLPAGEYTLNIEYSATVDPEDPGTESASAAVDVNIFFFRTCTKLGDNGVNTLNGTNGDDVICGRGGNDRINGRGGSDLVFGQNGADAISGGSGPDDLRGEGGADVIRGQAGGDHLDGGAARDTISGGAENDVIQAHDGTGEPVDGGAGNRDVAVADRRDQLTRVEVIRH